MKQMTPDPYAGYDAARESAAVGERGMRGWIDVSGADAVSFLHGILTNDIATLEEGRWRYAAYLTPQGRMLSDMRVLRRGLDVALETEPQVSEMLARRFEASIFTERVGIALMSAEPTETAPLHDKQEAGTALGSLIVCGPTLHEVLQTALAPADRVQRLDPGAFVELDRCGERLVLIGHQDLGVPAVDVIAPGHALESLMESLAAAGASRLTTVALEALRIEAGVPRFGVDMTAETIPLEAGIEARAISSTKGCYVGQEVIVRILHRGHGRVARRLVGLIVQSPEPPAPGSRLSADGREVGHITSTAFSPRFDSAIALGYVHRDFAEPGTVLWVAATDTPVRVGQVPLMKV
jgi:folate-binding protein YgfZ